MYLHLIEKAIINSSLRHSKMVQNGQLIYTDNLFLLYMSYCFVWHILTALILAEYRTRNRVKMAGSTYQDNMVKMVGWNGRVGMSFFYICYTMFLPSQVFLFLERLCAGQGWFHWEWTKTKSDKLTKICVSLELFFLREKHLWRKSQEIFLIDPLWVMYSFWTNHCGQEGVAFLAYTLTSVGEGPGGGDIGWRGWWSSNKGKEGWCF